MFAINIISNDEIQLFYRATSSLKKLKTRLPKELLRMYIAGLNDIPYESDYGWPDLLDNVYDLVEIKRIIAIY
jgi:hypothetical protein